MKIPKDPEWQQEVGARLRQAILALGKKQVDIANILGISPGRLSNYIRGERPLDIEQAIKLAGRFGITLDFLYIGDVRGLPYELAQRIAPIGGENVRPN